MTVWNSFVINFKYMYAYCSNVLACGSLYLQTIIKIETYFNYQNRIIVAHANEILNNIGGVTLYLYGTLNKRHMYMVKSTLHLIDVTPF